MNTQAVVDLTQSLGWIINQEKSELEPTQVFSFVGYEYHLDSALVKPTQERWLKPKISEPQTSTVRVSSPRSKCLGHRCSKHKLGGSHCLCLPSDGSPSQGDPKNQAMPLPDHRYSPRLARDALVLGPSAALNRDPTSTSSVNNSSQTVPQVCVPQQSSTSQPPRLVSRSGQLQEQGFSVEVAERIAAPQRFYQQGPSTSQSGPFLRNGASKTRWISPLHL